jgi:hypothetical protein
MLHGAPLISREGSSVENRALHQKYLADGRVLPLKAFSLPRVPTIS